MFTFLSFRIYTVLLVCIACVNQDPPRRLNANSKQSDTTLKTMVEPCEDCELMLEGIPENIASTDTSEGWFYEGQPLIIRGTVYTQDKKSIAPGVTLYYYHTDKHGHYTPNDNVPIRARRHGYLRGWVKSDANGHFAIYTNRPAQYPGGRFEAHIHVIVQEPGMDRPYWIDPWIFDDDPLVTDELIARLENRGGSGVLSTKFENGVEVAQHDIILGLNITGYTR